MDWKNIIAEIQRLGQMTQPQIAEKVGCSQATISDLINAKTKQPSYPLGIAITGLLEKLQGNPMAANPEKEVSHAWPTHSSTSKNLSVVVGVRTP